MATTVRRALNHLRGRIRCSHGGRGIAGAPRAEGPPSNLYSTTRQRVSLASIVYPLGHPSISLVPELDRWIGKKNRARPVELRELIRDLRQRRRYAQALEVSEWMNDKGNLPSTSSDIAVRLDLIGRVRGLESAESCFKYLQEKDKCHRTYGALLNCYVRECLAEKSLHLFQKMKDLGFASTALPYNDIMCLYSNTGKYEVVPSVLAEMKENGVCPDNFSYRICINSYGERSNIKEMEELLEEMEYQPQIVVDWNTYSVVASVYIKAGMKEKGISALKKTEEKLEKRNHLCYDHLLSHYGNLGNKSELWRIWNLQKSNGLKFVNKDYSTMLGSLVKLGELEECEKLLREWESSDNSYDFRVPMVLLAGYCRKGLLERAEEMIVSFLNKGKTPPSSYWGIVAGGYAEKGEMNKAYDFLKNALTVYVPKGGWKPNPKVVKDMLQWVGDEVEVDGAETFIELLKVAVPMDRDMYHALIKVNTRAARDVNTILDRMRADGFEEEEETPDIRGSLKS